MGLFKQFKLPVHSDARFSLIPLEVTEQLLDFSIKRVYAIVKAKQPTGSHSHRQEKECFICYQGSLTAVIDADGQGQREIEMTVGDAIYVGTYVWHHFKNFSPDSVLVALSSTNYDVTRQDYIKDYEEFKKQVQLNH